MPVSETIPFLLKRMMDSGVLDRIYRWFMPLEGLKDPKENKEEKLVREICLLCCAHNFSPPLPLARFLTTL